MIDYESITYEHLTRKHPDLAAWEYALANFRLMYRGGEEFRQAAGQSGQAFVQPVSGSSSVTAANRSTAGWTPRRFLYQLENEPDKKYQHRWQRCFDVNYIKAIADYFSLYLFTVPPIIRPSGGAETPEWWSEFSKDATGGGKTFEDFVRDVFADTLIVRRGGWLIGTPDIRAAGMSRAEAEAAGIARPALVPYKAEEIIYWERDDAEELKYVILRKCSMVREFPNDPIQIETFTYIDRDSWGVWEVRQDDEKPGAALVGSGPHKIGRVPFVMIELPHGMWLANQLYSWQIDIFNQTNMLAYGILMSCFLQPYIKTHEDGGVASNRIYSEGTIIQLRAGREGREGEETGWITADVDPLRFNAETLKDKRDEGYRIVHQMALAVDQQAVNVSRSGVSKQEDRRATDVILCGYGGIVRDPIVRTANIISRIYGDGVTWECSGFDDFSAPDLADILAAAMQADTLKIPSPTFKKAMLSQVATGPLIGRTDDATKEAIRQEINAAIEMEREQAIAAEKSGVTTSAKIELTPSAQAQVVTMNEARVYGMHLPERTMEGGGAHPDGFKTLAEIDQELAAKAKTQEAALQPGAKVTSDRDDRPGGEE